jgi:hypothetical protein
VTQPAAPHAEPAVPGGSGWPHGRRRTAFGVLALGVVAAHWLLALLLPQVRIGEGSADRMPRRIEVAYVRELQQAAPPAAPPVVVGAKKPARAKAAAPPVAAASAPEAAASAAEPDDTRQARSGTADEPAPQAAAAAASAVDEAASAPMVAAVDSAASAPAAFEWPPSTRLTYSLSGNYRGEVSGGAMVEWVRAGLRYQVHLDVWVGAQAAPLVGRRMTSDGELTDQGLVPKRYDEETRALFREVRRRTIRFEPDRVVLPNGSERERPPALQDAASQFVQLTWLFTTRPDLLQPGRSVEVALALPTNVSHWAYDVLGKATVQTPIGPVEAYHMKPRRQARPGGDLVAEVWFAPTLMYLPVRLLIRQDEATYIDMILDRAPLQAAAASAPN